MNPVKGVVLARELCRRHGRDPDTMVLIPGPHGLPHLEQIATPKGVAYSAGELIPLWTAWYPTALDAIAATTEISAGRSIHESSSDLGHG